VEEHYSEMFEDEVLKKTFATKKVEVSGKWRILHNEELRNVRVYR